VGKAFNAPYGGRMNKKLVRCGKHPTHPTGMNENNGALEKRLIHPVKKVLL
jgi:hypothetical protein